MPIQSVYTLCTFRRRSAIRKSTIGIKKQVEAEATVEGAVQRL